MRRILLVLLVGLAALGPAPRLGAQEDSLEASKRRELETIQRQAREKRAAATQLKGREQKELVQLRRTERDLGSSRRRLRTLEQRGRQLDRQLQITLADLQRSQSTLKDQQVRLSARLRNVYKYGVGRELEFLLSPRSFAELLARWDYLVMIAEQDRIILEDVQAKKEIVVANQERLQTTLQDVTRTQKRTDQESKRLSSLRQKRASTVEAIKSQRETYEAAATELEKTARAIQGLLARLERERKARQQGGAAPVPYSGDFAKGRGQLDWPVRGSLVGHYGPEKHPRWGTVTLNNGVDIESPIGTPVRAVARGRVDYTSSDFGSYGEIVILNHGDGYYTLYGHLSGISVSVGQEVTSGQTIGASGDTGSLKGPILHFEVRQGGASLNPEDWLR